MSAADRLPKVEERLSHSRACMVSSLERVARSRERIRDSLQSAAQVMARVSGVRPACDDELAACLERSEAQAQQRQIDREARLSRAALFI